MPANSQPYTVCCSKAYTFAMFMLRVILKFHLSLYCKCVNHDINYSNDL